VKAFNHHLLSEVVYYVVSLEKHSSIPISFPKLPYNKYQSNQKTSKRITRGVPCPRHVIRKRENHSKEVADAGSQSVKEVTAPTELV